MNKILLHTCCAPCSSAIIEWMLQNGIKPVIFYSNSNIYPREEYEHRRSECQRYAAENGLEMIEDEYDHEGWKEAVAKGLENEPERGGRCLKCFRYRLGRAAEYAGRNGYDTLTTTLASSRWKSLEQINAAGSEACTDIPEVEWWDKNWRKGGLQERRNQIIKERNFYNQLYCGCEFSMPKDEKVKENESVIFCNMKTTDNTQNKQLSELSDEELKEVTGGAKQKFERTKHVCKIIDYVSCPNGVTHDKYNCLVCK